jgi:hypothetical protein
MTLTKVLGLFSAIIDSDAVQAVLRPVKLTPAKNLVKVNPFRNKEAREKLDPLFKLKRHAS